MLKSKIKFARWARKEVSAFSLSTLRSRVTAEDGQPSAFACSAFTLLELLVVISILGLLAALTLPVLKNFGKSDATLGASRQLLDGVARARQLAMSDRTTVYMVFLPTNFWVDRSQTFPGAANSWWGSLSPSLQTAVTNLADKQLSGYNFVAYGAIGDQPGQHAWHYLDRWQALPDGTFIALAKFTNAPGQTTPSYYINDPIYASQSYPIYGFHTNLAIPFPSEQGTNTYAARIALPYIAFNYLGQLTFDGVNLADRDEYIPLAHGSVFAALDPATKILQLWGPPKVYGSPEVQEVPPGNSTNISYSVVYIDRLTGRAVLKFHKMTP